MTFLTTSLLVTASTVGWEETADAAANPWPHTIVNGFATPSGDGFWLVFADGTVLAYGDAIFYGDASNLPLAGPVVGGAVTPSGKGYWLVAQDGGIFSFGDAVFYGSMGGIPLNQPVFSMSSTKSGKGYWLVAFDGGIFSFGDAAFYGSTGALTLNEPINGITTSPSGKGYRMAAGDGGMFSFGDVPFFGSLPGIGVIVSDVVGMAPTPTNRGYWILRAGGEVYPFGDAHNFGNFIGPLADPAAAIFANPNAQGYRIVTRSGATFPFGAAPGGSEWADGFPLETDPTIICPSGIVTFTIDSFDADYIPMSGYWNGDWTGTLDNGSTGAIWVHSLDVTVAGQGGTSDVSFGTFDGGDFSVTLAPGAASSVEGVFFFIEAPFIDGVSTVRATSAAISFEWVDGDAPPFFSIHCPMAGFDAI